MADKLDIYRAAKDLIDKYGLEEADKVVIERKSLLNSEGNLFELSVWRDIHTALKKLTVEIEADGNG